MTETLCGQKDPLHKLSKEALRRNVAVDYHTCSFFQTDNFDHHVTQKLKSRRQSRGNITLRISVCTYLELHLLIPYLGWIRLLP